MNDSITKNYQEKLLKRTRDFDNMDETKNSFLKKAKINEIYRYDILDHQLKIHELIHRGTLINLTDYIDYPVMYMFIVPLKIKEHEDVIVKIGYSSDICERIKTLKSEYKSDIHLIGLRLIKSEKIEKHFHKLLHEVYPENIEDKVLGEKNKIELYKLSEKIIKEFDSIPEESVKKIPSRFNHPHLVPYIDLVNDCDSSDDSQSSFEQRNRLQEMYYAHMRDTENNLHELLMKDKEIELKKLNLELFRSNNV